MIKSYSEKSADCKNLLNIKVQDFIYLYLDSQVDPGQLGNGIPVVFSGSTPGCNVLGTTPEGGTKRTPSPAAQPQLLSNSWRGGSALKSSCITELRTFCPPTHSFSYYSETLITGKSYRFVPHLDFRVFVHKEHVQKKEFKTIKTNVTSE